MLIPGLAERYLRRRFQEGKQQGVEEGIQLLAEKVKEWNERRLEAKRRGEDFNEPLPTDV